MGSAAGLAVGRGTGPELATVSTRTVEKFGLLYGTEIEIARSPRIYHSYLELCQPDTVNRNLIERGLPVRTLVISGNDQREILRFMRRVYGAHVTTHDHPEAPWPALAT